jgi:hypothetical protein
MVVSFFDEMRLVGGNGNIKIEMEKDKENMSPLLLLFFWC